MDCSTPGLPVHHQLLEFTQTHVHWVSDAIQPSHPLLSPSTPVFNLSQNKYWYKIKYYHCCSVYKSVQFIEIPWTAAHQVPLSSINSWSWLKFMSTESVMLSDHLILCCPLLLLPSTLPIIRVFSNESALRTSWPKYWSFSITIIIKLLIRT